MQDEIIKTIEENGVKVTIGRVLSGEHKDIEIFHIRGYRQEGQGMVKEYGSRNTLAEAEVRAEQMLSNLSVKPTGLRWDDKRKKAVPV